MSQQSPLRDLIVKIDDVARYHPAYPQACHALNNLRDHLSAIAYAEEVNQREAGDTPKTYRR